MKRGLALGCGGVIGAAWQIGVLSALERALDWDAREAELIIGTSGGAELALCLGSGIAVSALVDAQRGAPGADGLLSAHFRAAPGPLPPLPALGLPHRRLLAASLRGRAGLLAAGASVLPRGGDRPTWLATLADHLVAPGAWVRHPNTWMVAADLASGTRQAFGAAGAPPAGARQALLASWAIPGWFPPVQIDGRRYADGGVLSTASADLAVGQDLDELVVLTPMTSARGVRPRGPGGVLEGVMRRRMSVGLTTELERVRAAGIRVRLVQADAEDLQVMGANFMSHRRRLATLEHALRRVS